MAILEQEMLSFSFNLNKAPEAFERLLLILKESLKKYHVYVRLVKVLSHNRIAVKVTTEEDINIENFDEVILLSEFASYLAKTTTEEPVALYCQFEKGELSLKGVRSVGWTTTLDGDVVEVEDAKKKVETKKQKTDASAKKETSGETTKKQGTKKSTSSTKKKTEKQNKD